MMLKPIVALAILSIALVWGISLLGAGIDKYYATPASVATVTPTRMPTPTATPTATSTSTPSTPYIEASSVIVEPLPTIRGGNLAALPLPLGTRVVYGGCASDGTCYPYNFYWAPTHEVVLVGTNTNNQEAHELCHAHQHWTINGGSPLPPSDYDLESWYGTSEGQSFMAAVEGLSFPWTLSAANGLEDFAWTCANWYKNPQRLLDVGGQARYEWAKKNLP